MKKILTFVAIIFSLMGEAHAEYALDRPTLSDNSLAVFFRESPLSLYQGGMQRQWERKRPALTRLGDWVLSPPVVDCAGLTRAANGAPLPPPLQWMPDGYADCGAIAVLGSAAKPKYRLFDHLHLAREIYRHLDASTIPWSLTKVLGRTGSYTLSEVKGLKSSFYFEQLSIFVGDRDYYIMFEVSAGFLGDGREKILVTIGDRHDPKPPGKFHMSEGVMLLTRERKGGPIVARPIVLRRPPSFTPPAPAAPDKW